MAPRTDTAHRSFFGLWEFADGDGDADAIMAETALMDVLLDASSVAAELSHSIFSEGALLVTASEKDWLNPGPPADPHQDCAGAKPTIACSSECEGIAVMDVSLGADDHASLQPFFLEMSLEELCSPFFFIPGMAPPLHSLAGAGFSVRMEKEAPVPTVLPTRKGSDFWSFGVDAAGIPNNLLAICAA